MFTKVEQIHADIKLKEQMQRAYVKNVKPCGSSRLEVMIASRRK